MLDLFFKNKEIENAKQAVKKQPDNIIYQEILGDLYYKYNYIQDAINTYENILKQDENYQPVLMKVGKCYLDKKHFLKAFRTLKHLYNLNPSDNFAKEKLLALKDIEASLEIKIIILKELASIWDDDNDILELLAQNYLKDGQFTNCISSYEKLCEIDEKERYLRALCFVYQRLQNSEKAIVFLEKLLLKNCIKDDEIKNLASLYAKVGRLDEAKGVFELLAERNPKERGQLKNEISKILLQENNTDKAIDVSTEALKENEFDFQAKFIIAQAYIEKKEYKTALNFLQEFYFDPLPESEQKKVLDMFIDTTIKYSKELTEKKEYQEAIDILVPALRYRENEPQIYYQLAFISEQIKDFTSQKDYLKTAQEYERLKNNK